MSGRGDVVLNVLKDIEENHRVIGVRRQRAVSEIEPNKWNVRHLLAEFDKRSERVITAGQCRIGQAATHIGKQVTGGTAYLHNRCRLCAQRSPEFVDWVIAR